MQPVGRAAAGWPGEGLNPRIVIGMAYKKVPLLGGQTLSQTLPRPGRSRGRAEVAWTLPGRPNHRFFDTNLAILLASSLPARSCSHLVVAIPITILVWARLFFDANLAILLASSLAGPRPCARVCRQTYHYSSLRGRSLVQLSADIARIVPYY